MRKSFAGPASSPVAKQITVEVRDAELRVVRGANHMVFCSPADPSCAAVRSDRPLAAEVEGEASRIQRASTDGIEKHGKDGLHTPFLMEPGWRIDTRMSKHFMKSYRQMQDLSRMSWQMEHYEAGRAFESIVV